MLSLKVSSLALLALFALGACGSEDPNIEPTVVIMYFDHEEQDYANCSDYSTRDEGRVWLCQNPESGRWEHYPERTIDHMRYED